AKLSGLVPVIGVVSGYCFAGNAAMLGCCDVIIATMNASIGMGGPAMIEGGGLGVYHPAEVGPVSFQSPHGVIDILVEDVAEAPAGDKAARFMQLCDAFDIPILSLCDTPGFMVGPEAEKTAIVRHVARMFVTGASLTVPLFGIVLRKGYGLGAQSMIGGGFHASFFTVAWPTGEFGGMGLEGYVRLGFRKEMEAIADPAERETFYRNKVAELY